MTTIADDHTAEQNLLVSVVVIGRNEGQRLVRCLKSVFGTNHSDFGLEVIYVDSASTDDSVAAAKAEGAITIGLTQAHPSAATGRNAGWKAASGEIVLFLDGDTVLHPEFVGSSLPDFASSSIAVVWGHRRELFPESSIYNRVLDLDWVYPPGLAEYCGGDALYRRSVLVETDGFDGSLVAGEEPELCQRIRALGFEILHVDRPMTGHDLAITRWSQYWKRLTRAGHAYAEIADRFRNTDQPFWSREAAANRNRFLVLTLSLVASVAASILLRNLFPLAGCCIFFHLLFLRSAHRARWKTSNRITLICYGVHAQFQQIPIFWGQLHHRWNRWRGTRASLFEYK